MTTSRARVCKVNWIDSEGKLRHADVFQDGNYLVTDDDYVLPNPQWLAKRDRDHGVAWDTETAKSWYYKNMHYLSSGAPTPGAPVSASERTPEPADVEARTPERTRSDENILKGLFDPSGRYTRGEYATLVFFGFLISFLLAFINQLAQYDEVLGPLFTLAYAVWGLLVIPANVVACVRRLHDMSESGVWAWLLLVPIANLLLVLSLLFTPTKVAK